MKRELYYLGNVINVFRNSLCNESTISATLDLVRIHLEKLLLSVRYAMRYTRVAAVAYEFQLTVKFETKRKHVNIQIF